LFTNTNKLVTKKTQYTNAANATSDISFGALINMSNASPKMLSFKLLYTVTTSALQHGLHSGSFSDIVDVSAPLS